MAWNIPDKGTADNDAQSVVYNTDLDVLSAGIAGVDCVLSGLDFTGGADMTPDISKGAVLSNGVMFAVAAASVTHTTADATNPRFDLVVVTSAGALAVRAGTPAASPKPPARTANDVVIRRVYIGAGDTSISTAQSTDMRVFRTQGAITIAKSATAVTVNTTSAQTALCTVTIPNGLFLTGRKLRWTGYGSLLNNTGSSQDGAVLAIYGGTTLWAEAMPSFAASSTRRAWSWGFVLDAVSSSSQKIGGLYNVGGTTGATTGTGDISALLGTGSLLGTSAIDSDAANRDLVVAIDFVGSSATLEFVLESYSLELV